MRHFVALAALAALFSFGSNAANAALVVGFNLGDSTVTEFGGGLVTVTTNPVIRTNGLAANSAAPVVTSISAAGDVLTTFSASFGLDSPTPLVWFDFRGASEGNAIASWEATIAAGGGSITKTGMFSGTGTVGQEMDLTGLGPVSSGSIQFSMSGGRLIDDGGFLPQSGFQGFAAVTAVPEPSMIAGLAVLSGAGFLVHRRRRQTAAKA